MQVSARKLDMSAYRKRIRQTLRSHLQNLLAIDLDGGDVVARDLAVLGGVRTSGLEDVLIDEGLHGGSRRLLLHDGVVSIRI